jgi:hypothetical protein
MIQFGAKNERRGKRERGAARRRLRPAVIMLESRELLSTLTVSNTNDNGGGSLRAAVDQANSDHGGDTIVFSSLFNTPQTITLTSGQLELNGTAGTTMIQGPGANLLSVSANNTTNASSTLNLRVHTFHFRSHVVDVARNFPAPAGIASPKI